jgi:thiol-disulfide isomerase/thioredoxin
MESEGWKSVGKIFASIALSALIAFFWISNYKKSSIKKYQADEVQTQGLVLKENLKKPLNLVSFWATWCTDCANNLKSFDGLSADIGPDFHFLAVNLDKDPVDARGFWNQLELVQTELVFDEDKNLRKALSVEVLPTYFLIDKTGKLLLRLEGNIQWGDPKVITLLRSFEDS